MAQTHSRCQVQVTATSRGHNTSFRDARLLLRRIHMETFTWAVWHLPTLCKRPVQQNTSNLAALGPSA